MSKRSAFETRTNAPTQALARARAGSRRLIDLTLSNPTSSSLALPDVEPLPAAPSYAPEPLGDFKARCAIAELYHDLDPGRVLLTASTSEAYGFLFTLLCDPGDEVLVPQPSYPLLAHLARQRDVQLVGYPLSYHGMRWAIDLWALRSAVSKRTRAVVVVSPNNPTGSYLKHEELDALLALGLPIIADEVFAPYLVCPEDRPRVETVLQAGERGLVFALGGLSKALALPQMKLAWIAAGGSARSVGRALSRLELIADAHLSVGTPIQLAAPTLLARRERVWEVITERLRKNLGALVEALEGSPATVLDVEGGWYAVVRLPAVESEDDFVVGLLEEDGVIVWPGYFFDFARPCFVVVSLLVPPDDLVRGARCLAARATRSALAVG